VSRPTPNQKGVADARRRREQIVEAVETYRAEHGGLGPTRSELAEIVGLSLKTVEQHVRTLKNEGTLIEHGVRTLRLNE
jgi:DNA-binding GntR family transcriptional regulator